MSDHLCPNRGSLNFISRLQDSSIAKRLNAFFYSPFYITLIGILALAANIFALELPVYSIYILLAVMISLFGKDYLPIIPIVICSYIVPSVNNNPGRNETSIFFGATGVFILCLAAAFVLSLILRLAMDPTIGRKAFFTKKRIFLPGILALGASYLLSGAFSGHYWDRGYRNLVFASLQFLSVFLLYYLLSGAVQWKTAPKNYLAWVGFCVGFVLLGEILNIYFTHDIFVPGDVLRSYICTGWGHYNNMGVLLAMMIPFAFQLACTSKHGWFFYLCGAVLFAGLLLTLSRSSILFGCFGFAASFFLTLARAKDRRNVLIANGFLIGAALVLLVAIREPLTAVLNNLLTSVESMNVRQEGYVAGFQQFSDYPIFGGTFFPLHIKLFEYSNVEAFSAFFPARWHNTFVQLLASGGIVCLSAYLLHRAQTIRFLLRKPTINVLFIGISASMLLLCSLLDCHFFNIGPTLFYSMALAFGEHCPRSKS